MQKIAWRQEECFNRQKEENLQLKEQVLQHQKEVAELQIENIDLKAGRVPGVRSLATQTRTEVPEASRDPTYPIINKVKHTLTAGVPRKLLNELRRDLSLAQHMNRQLKRQLDKQDADAEEEMISLSAIQPKIEVYNQIITHTAPLESVMQCHMAYAGLNLLLSGLSLFQTGCRLDSKQAKRIWDKADATAKDTIVFMWCSEELKMPLGTMEVLSACPPFYLKRYVLRCIKLLGQHSKHPEILKEPLPALRSYSHGQYHLIRNFQKSKPGWFKQALTTLAAEDIAVCHEAVKIY